MIQVLSYNIRFGWKLSHIIKWLASQSTHYDVICLQEFPQSKLEYVMRHLDSPYKSLFSHTFTIGRSVYGPLTIYDSSKLRTLASTVLPLGTSVVEAALHMNSKPRTALVTRLANGEGELVLANAHLACLAVNKVRRKQLGIILDHLRHIVQAPPVAKIILGDFNYTSFMKQNSLMQLMKNNNFANAYRSMTHRLLFIKHQLDYAFYQNCQIKNVKIENLRYSDHYAVSFEVHF